MLIPFAPKVRNSPKFTKTENVFHLQFPVSFVTQRNATGHIVHADGMQIHMLEALSKMLNFR